MPCDYKKYPDNWKSEIRPAILERDNYCCNFCGVDNYAQGYRDIDGTFYKTEFIINSLDKNGVDMFAGVLDNCFDKKGNPTKPIKIVLTIMHLDHDTTNNDYDNLVAACQKCHLNYDKEHHMKNSRETIRKKKGLQKLF